MTCPHCRVAIHAKPETVPIGYDADGAWIVQTILCPACNRLILDLKRGTARKFQGRLVDLDTTYETHLVRPKGHGRSPTPAEVPDAIRGDYEEACAVLSDSPKASAALSRRCLQNVLRTSAGVKAADLAVEIQAVLDSTTLPAPLAESIDAIRNIGNFGAHPMKSKHTGEIVDVEAGEAEWNLDVLESLFDFYYVQPAVLKKKREALDKKLEAFGKPPLKKP